MSPEFHRKRMESIIHVYMISIAIFHRRRKRLRGDSHHFIRGNLLEHGVTFPFYRVREINPLRIDIAITPENTNISGFTDLFSLYEPNRL